MMTSRLGETKRAATESELSAPISLGGFLIAPRQDPSRTRKVARANAGAPSRGRDGAGVHLADLPLNHVPPPRRRGKAPPRLQAPGSDDLSPGTEPSDLFLGRTPRSRSASSARWWSRTSWPRLRGHRELEQFNRQLLEFLDRAFRDCGIAPRARSRSADRRLHDRDGPGSEPARTSPKPSASWESQALRLLTIQEVERSVPVTLLATLGDDVPVEAQIRHVSIHGHQMAYHMEGEGPALLLLHGIAGSARTWRDVIPLLTDRFTVIAPDLMGHGLSEKPVGDYSLGAFASGIRDLLEVLDVDRASVVGQSFGGGVAMQLAYQHPEICDRLVLVDSGGLGREVNWILRFMTLPGSEYVMPLIFPGFLRDWGDGLLRSINARGIRLGRITEMWSAYASLAEAENRQAFARTIRSVIDPGGQTVSAMDRLYLASPMPTLIIWGDQDDIIPVSHAHAAHQAIPGSRLVIVEGVGHFPQIEAPDQFVAALVDFVDSTESARVTAEDRQRMLKERSDRSKH